MIRFYLNIAKSLNAVIFFAVIIIKDSLFAPSEYVLYLDKDRAWVRIAIDWKLGELKASVAKLNPLSFLRNNIFHNTYDTLLNSYHQFLHSVEHMRSKRPSILSAWQAMLSCRRCNSQLLSIDLKRFSSSKRWQSRQRSDIFTREAVVRGLKSRAAFKLLQVRFSQLCFFRKELLWTAC